MSMDRYYAVIMAGGGGTRLWPLSQRARPKQSLTLFGRRSLFQIAVDRIRPLIPLERVRVVTVAEQLAMLRDQVGDLPASSYVIEPAPRGTASVVGLAAVSLFAQDPEAIMCVLTADHFIRDEEKFRQLLSAAYQQAQEGHLVTLGIAPTAASTGYGYLEIGLETDAVGEFAVHRVESFQEKPDGETAKQYFESGRYLWNSGMFVWRVDRIVEEIERHMPELAKGLARIRAAVAGGSERAVIEGVWRELRSQTIDYGVMEKAQDVVVLPAEELGWWDVGSWNRLFDLLESDSQGNLVMADSTLLLDTSSTLVVQDAEVGRVEPGDRLIATLGVDNLVIVDTGRALLVTTRDNAENVRAVVERLDELGYEQYL